MTKTRILGLDTGTNSLGWAIVDRDELSGQYELIYRGDLIFTEGVKVEKAKSPLKQLIEPSTEVYASSISVVVCVRLRCCACCLLIIYVHLSARPNYISGMSRRYILWKMRNLCFGSAQMITKVRILIIIGIFVFILS